MITKDNFKTVLTELGFTQIENIFYKNFNNNYELTVDFEKQKLNFIDEKSSEKITVNDTTTSNFSHPENFVVFECVCRLLEKGYKPQDIELEPRWSLGHGEKSGKADICVKNKDGSKYLFIIECKTFGTEFNKEIKNMESDGGQLFSYWQQERATKYLVLYSADITENHKNENSLTHQIKTINCTDDPNLIELSKETHENEKAKLYKNAKSVTDLFEVWNEVYNKKFYEDIIFDEDTKAYDIGLPALKKKRLKDFSTELKIVNQFEEILRHNNVSDKENAFNRLIALFVAKLYDEKTKGENDIVEFQYINGSDTYRVLQDRLQSLHSKGMKQFMEEEIFYVEPDYVKKVTTKSLHEERKDLIRELEQTIDKLKFYTNNDFAFKDVHNEELFLQNGKILVEMVELFQNFRIINSNSLQLLGDMFEQLLNKGFKQNEGQFFTPVPITRFIWKALPVEKFLNDLKDKSTLPRVIDYACGAGHFLTEGFREINEACKNLEITCNKGWERDCIFGIEKDYRLARVSKISLFMHGADEGNIIFGDGLDNHNSKENSGKPRIPVIENKQFSILVANPPYSVSGFKNHLELKNNNFELDKCVSKDAKEIETFFIERTAQLLKPNGLAAVILPSSILSNSSASYIKAREIILENFDIHSIVQFGSKTFGATGTNTIVLFMQKYDEPPTKSKIVNDNVNAIFEAKTLDDIKITSDIEIFNEYCKHVNIQKNDFIQFLCDALNKNDIEKYKPTEQNKNISYFTQYYAEITKSADFVNASKNKEKQTKLFYEKIITTEKDKLKYFALVYTQKTLVITSPSDNAEQEKFLGYSWSNRKGDEGIKLKDVTNAQNKCGLLYNTKQKDLSLAECVKNSFIDKENIKENINKDLAQFAQMQNLADMLDFSRTSFDKAIKTNVTKKVEIKSKWELVKLGDVAEIVRGVTFDKNLQLNEKTDKVVLTADNVTLDGKFVIEKEIYVSNEANFEDEKKLRKNDLFMCFSSGSRTHVGKVALITEDTNYYAGGFMGILRANKISPFYLYNILNYPIVREIVKNNATGSNILNLSNSIAELSIPLPPVETQKQIVNECQKIDIAYNNAKAQIEELKAEIENIMQNVTGEMKKLGDVCEYNKYSINPKDTPNKEFIYIDIESVENGTGKISFDKKIIGNNAPSRARRLAKSNSTLISTVRPNLKGFAYLENEIEDAVYSTGFAIIKSKNNEILRDKMIYLYFMYSNDLMNQMIGAMPKGQYPSINSSDIDNFTIPVPPLAEQEKIVEQIADKEKLIQDAKNLLATCPAQKQKVLDEWL